MTKLFMFLFADDYGLFGTCPILNAFFILVATIIVVLFIIDLWKSESEFKKVISLSTFYFVFLASLYYAFFTITPVQIPEYGTDTQKSNLTRCVDRYTQSKHVRMDVVTYDNIISIMRDCKDGDEINATLQEQQLKDKQFQDSIRNIRVKTNQ